MSKLELRKSVLGPIYTNVYFLKNKETGEVIIIDPAVQADRIEQAVASIGGKPAAILLTHGHFDHIMAVGAVKERYGIPVYAARPEKPLLENPPKDMMPYRSPDPVKPDVLLDDDQVLELAGFRIRVFLTPGHTKGSCCYYIEDEGVLFSGDTLFLESMGRTDFPGGSMSEIVASLHRLLDTLPEETEVYPGHDAATTIAHEKRYNPFV